ncbi:MAG: HesB/IscA family protein [Halanaeroarchaeum sp.]
MSSKPTSNTNTPPIEFTESAIERARDAIEEEADEPPATGLRVVAREKNCNCGSLAYQLVFERDPADSDSVYIVDDLDIVLDPETRELVTGATVDYVAGPGEAGFTVDNPTERGGCGCGGHH